MLGNYQHVDIDSSNAYQQEKAYRISKYELDERDIILDYMLALKHPQMFQLKNQNVQLTKLEESDKLYSLIPQCTRKTLRLVNFIN